MGMYTEIVVKFDFNKADLSDLENKVLDYLFNPNSTQLDVPTELPNHHFFTNSRWSAIGHCSSFYHHPKTVSSWVESEFSPDDVYVFNRSDLKNYSDEINNFFDWLNSLNCMHNGDYLGYSLYEEHNTPTIYNKNCRESTESLHS